MRTRNTLIKKMKQNKQYHNSKIYIMQLQSGTSLQGGKYKIEKILGQGGFGITYLCTHIYLNKRVAIKEFYPKDFFGRDENQKSITCTNNILAERFLNKFIKEAQIIAQLSHPNIINVTDVFQENGTAYYVMDFIEGISFSEELKLKRNGYSLQEAFPYINQVANALKYIHSKNLLHLDIKPANLLKQDDGKVILIDFGISKRYDDELNETSTTQGATSSGYSPIEQYKKGGLNNFSPATDIYALGATFYHLLSGIRPPEAIDRLDGSLQSIPNVETYINEAIKKAMEPQKIKRIQSVEQFMALLKPISDHKEIDNTSTQTAKDTIINDLEATQISEWDEVLKKLESIHDIDEARHLCHAIPKEIIRKYRSNYWGCSLLHFAVKNANVALVCFYLKEIGIDPNIVDQFGTSPIKYTTLDYIKKLF